MLMVPSRKCFECIQTLDYDRFFDLPLHDVRLILPFLVRICHSDTLDVSKRWNKIRLKLKCLLLPFPEATDLRQLLELDYVQLESEVKKDLQLRLKAPQTQTPYSPSLLANILQQPSSQVANSCGDCLVKIFEKEQLNVRMKLVLSELLALLVHLKNNISINNQQQSNVCPVPSELFDTDIYVDEFVDFIYFACYEMPNTFPLFEVVEALLLIKNGLPIICCLISNFPDSFHEVCSTLINNSEQQKEEINFVATNRVNVLRKLCQMNPSAALIVRSQAVELCRMPNLVVMLTLDYLKRNVDSSQKKEEYQNEDEEEDEDENGSDSDVISFITGILLSNNDKIRTWFSQYIKKKNQEPCFLEFRGQLLNRFRKVTESMIKLAIDSRKSPYVYNGDASNSDNDDADQLDEISSGSIITEACLMLRLYCALRGVAMLKLNDEETQAISRMIVCRPPHIDIGVRFVSVGLCMILAFPQMITSQETEIIEWIKWLVKEENYFGQKANTTASFGEMLLLIAIFFHSNQLQQIGELVSSTIGIKHPLRTNDLTLIKHIFIQDIFTEQTVTSHAIKVPVTKNLNDTINGALPIHCIYQLLKSRAFTKNNVPIKNWIFNQLCNCTPPIHHILPNLIEAYVNSILIPNIQSGHMTNEPIGENDLNSVFDRIVYSFEPDQIKSNCQKDKKVHHQQENAMDVDDDETEDENDCDDGKSSFNSISCLLTSQLLFLYYVLLYEDIRLNNARSLDRKTMSYSREFMSRLPITYLVQRTQTEEYGLLRPPLLRLISFHYPHLCLVKDWLPRPNFSVANHRILFSMCDSNQVKQILKQRKNLCRLFKKTMTSLKEELYNENSEPFLYLEQLMELPDELLWPLAQDFIRLLPWLLDVDVTPKKILILVRQTWFRLNHIFPTKLWVMTVNVLRESINEIGEWAYEQTWDGIVLDPCAVLRCDQRVFRIPELMEITLHILSGFLSASKIRSTHHIMENTNRNTLEEEKKKFEELFRTRCLLTDSAAVQMLLECCSPKIDEEIRQKFSSHHSNIDQDEAEEEENDQDDNLTECLLTNRREIQGLICTHLHQCFIAEWSLAKTVAFQGYDHELIPIVVAGIPSMHICLDFIPDILQCPEMDKQSFAIDLTSHLCVQYPIIRSFNVAKLCFDIAQIHLTLLGNDLRCRFYLKTLPAFERMCQMFPPLIEGFIKLLIQLAQRNLSALSSKPASIMLRSSDMLSFSCLQLAQPCSYTDKSSLESAVLMTEQNNPHRPKFTKSNLIEMSWTKFEEMIVRQMSLEEALTLAIHKTFAMICQLGPINRIFRDESL